MSLLARLKAVSVPPARNRRKPNKAHIQGFRFTPLRSRGAPAVPKSTDGRRYARIEMSRRAPARA